MLDMVQKGERKRLAASRAPLLPQSAVLPALKWHLRSGQMNGRLLKLYLRSFYEHVLRYAPY